MLSDERIRQIAMEYWSGTCGTRVPDMEKAIRAALTEADATLAMENNLKMLQVEAAHAIEMRAYEATVQNQAERIRQLEAGRVPEGMVDALVDWVRAAPHGDNCFLHNDGGEFDNCFCGKDSLLAAFDDDAAPAKEGE